MTCQQIFPIWLSLAAILFVTVFSLTMGLVMLIHYFTKEVCGG